MIAKVFALIQLVLLAFQQWDAFLDWMNDKHSKEMEERRQAREKAVDDQKGAQTEEEFDRAQDVIGKSKP